MYSPDLAASSQNGEIGLGFLRVESQPDVTYRVIAKEPIVVILPSDRPLAAGEAISPKSLNLRDKGINLTPSHRVENFSMVLSLVSSIRGVALMPAYVEALLPWSVVSRPLKGEKLIIDLAVGWRSDNQSPVLRTFLAGLDQLIAAGPAGTRRVS